jgi:ABC-type branched-subunit amino acid transport system ATPase component
MALKPAHRAYIIELGSISLEGDARDLADNDSVRRACLGG